MLELSRWKIAVVLASVIFGILFSLPNVLPDQVLAQWPGFLPHQRLNLGLDLQGGSSLLYEVDTDALKKERLGDLQEEASQELHDAQIQFSGLTATSGVVALKLTDLTQIDAAQTALAKVGGTIAGSGREVLVTHDAVGNFQIALTPAAIQQGVQRGRPVDRDHPPPDRPSGHQGARHPPAGGRPHRHRGARRERPAEAEGCDRPDRETHLPDGR